MTLIKACKNIESKWYAIICFEFLFDTFIRFMCFHSILSHDSFEEFWYWFCWVCWVIRGTSEIRLATFPDDSMGRVESPPIFPMLRSWMSVNLMLHSWHVCPLWIDVIHLYSVGICYFIFTIHASHSIWNYLILLNVMYIRHNFTSLSYWGPTPVFFLCCGCFWCHNRLSRGSWRVW